VNSCPICNRSDWSQPVSAIVNEQTHSTTSRGQSLGVAYSSSGAVPISTSYRTHSRSQTPLAAMLDLAPPRQPRISGCLVLSILAISGLFSVPGFITVISDNNGSRVGPLAAWLVPLATGIALVVLVNVLNHRQLRKWDARMELWHLALQFWATLRYCHRDGVVYQWPGVHLPPSATRQYVYDIARRAARPGRQGP
jgi:hypothetical protein